MESDRILSLVLSIINSSILATLRDPGPNIDALVAGGKAINSMLKLDYKVPTIDWDINAWDPRYVEDLTNPAHVKARDQLGNLIVRNLKPFINRERYRIRPIEENLGFQLQDVRFEVNPKLFPSFYGIEYTIGHVNLITDQGSFGIADLVPFPHSGDYLVFDRIKFPTLEVLISNLENLIKTTEYKRERNIGRLRIIDEALHHNGLSCNYYRANVIGQLARRPDPNYLPEIHRYGQGPITPPQRHRRIDSEILDRELDQINYGRELVLCGSQTIMGPLDPLVSLKSRVRPQYDINPADINRHSDYINNLTPIERSVLERYTGQESALWNMELYGQQMFGDRLRHPREILTLQEIILNSPPLENETTVYRVTRFLILDNEPCCFNRDTRDTREKGSIEKFPGFSSSSYDNYLNYGYFRDFGSACCAFVIKIPRGSRALIVDRLSAYANEREVIFPAGSSFILRKEDREFQITGVDRDDKIFYDSTITYFVDYQTPAPEPLTIEDLPPLIPIRSRRVGSSIPYLSPPLSPDLSPVDLSSIRDLDHLYWLETQPGFREILERIYQELAQLIPQ